MRALITIHIKGMHNNWLNQFYTAFQFPYMILAINKVDGRGLSNTVCHEYLAKKTKVMWYQPQKELHIAEKIRQSISVI